MSMWSLTPYEDALILAQTPAGRWRSAATRALVGLLVGALLTALLLAPMHLGAPSPPPVWASLASALSLGALLAVALGLSRLIVSERWIFDPGAGVLRHERALIGRAPSVVELDLQDVSAVRLSPDGSALIAELRPREDTPQGAQLILARGRAHDPQLAQLARRLGAAC